MSIDEAARATRRYVVEGHYVRDTTMAGMMPLPERYATEAEAQAACDRLNLAAVLEALREEMVSELQLAALKDDGTLQHAMHRFDALLAETKETTDA